MKYSKVFRVLTLAIILSLLLAAIPATPALAAKEIELDPSEGEIDEYFWVEGDGFPPSRRISCTQYCASEIRIYFSSQEAYEGDEAEDVRGGTYWVYVTMAGEDEIKAVAPFTVIAGEIELDTAEGVVGTQVEISGAHFADGEHTITAKDESGHRAEAVFAVKPEITISPTSGAAGDEVTVIGSGFGGEMNVAIILNGKDVAIDKTNEYGSFTASFDVPDVAEGSYDIEVEDEDGNKDEADFTLHIHMATEVSISPITSQASPGHVGMDIAISGAGFIANREIIITYATEPIVVATTTSTSTIIAGNGR